MKSFSNLPIFASAPFAALLASLPAAADEIAIPIDQVRTITLDRPAKTVFVGNPAIADVTVVDPRHVFLLGKSFGETNFITLDDTGRETANLQVIVTERPGTSVAVQRGIARTTMMCTPLHCEAAPAPGDDATSDTKQILAAPPYNVLSDQAQKRSDTSMKAATGGK